MSSTARRRVLVYSFLAFRYFSYLHSICIMTGSVLNFQVENQRILNLQDSLRHSAYTVGRTLWDGLQDLVDMAATRAEI